MPPAAGKRGSRRGGPEPEGGSATPRTTGRRTRSMARAERSAQEAGHTAGQQAAQPQTPQARRPQTRSQTRAAQAALESRTPAAAAALAATPGSVQELQSRGGNGATGQLLGQLAGEPPQAASSSAGTASPASVTSTPAPATSAPNSKYGIGEHGYKGYEQKRLSQAHGTTVSGASHQSEHTIGYEPLVRTGGMRGGQLPAASETGKGRSFTKTGGLTRGVDARAKDIENHAPAYQEVRGLHEKHIGTGNRKEHDASGFNAASYRDTQRKLLESGDVSSAVQINQLGYAFDPRFRANPEAKEQQVADDSYDRMVEHLHEVTFAQEDVDTTVEVDAYQRAEMYLARRAAETGQWPTLEEIEAAKRRFGITDT